MPSGTEIFQVKTPDIYWPHNLVICILVYIRIYTNQLVWWVCMLAWLVARAGLDEASLFTVLDATNCAYMHHHRTCARTHVPTYQPRVVLCFVRVIRLVFVY